MKSNFFLYIFMLLFISCSSHEIEENNRWLELPSPSFSFDYLGGTQIQSARITSGILPKSITYSYAGDGDKWCTVSINESTVTIKVEHSYIEKDRSTQVTIAYEDKNPVILSVSQSTAPSADDTKIKVVNATATSEEVSGKDADGNPLTLPMSYDGNVKTYYNSKFGKVNYPFTITYELDGVHTLNKIIYTPRTDAGNKWGSFDKFTVEGSTNEDPETFITLGEYSRGDNVQVPLEMPISHPLKNAKYVRFTVHKAYQDRISCAEMEFYEASKNSFNITSIFKDPLCTCLKEGVTRKQIYQIPDSNLLQLGLALLDNTYNPAYRHASYRPYQNPSIMSKINKMSKYSMRDGVTGLYAKAGEPLTAIVGSLYKGADVSLLIQDLNGGYNNYKIYTLQEGYNKIIPSVGGLIYVLNYTEDAVPLLLKTSEGKELASQETVEIHFPMASVNGYFDIAKNSEADWSDILRKATYQDIDVLGEYSHLTWRVSDFRKYNTNIIQTVKNLDNLVYNEEDWTGLVKNNKMFPNRMHICIDYKAKSPNSSDYRVVFNASDYYAQPFCEPDAFPSRCWGPAHEIGHSNQVRPGMKWAGMTEVTNNLMCLWEQEFLGRPCKLLVDGAQDSYKNFYERAINYIVLGKRAHCLPGESNIIRELQLVPFWQLKLYLVDVLGKKDFYRDLYEHFRITPDLDTSSKTQGILQLDFVRQVCNLAKINLIEFFRAWGFLTPVNTTLNDYGSKKFVITQEEIDALELEIQAKKYPKAPSELWKITENNLEDFH